jgi:hypothetical protein
VSEAKTEIIDIDILRPEKKIVILGKKEIDVSFIPLAITFEVNDLLNKLVKIAGNNPNKIKDDLITTKEALEVAVDLCVTFCSYKFPELDRKWFRENVDAYQMSKFVESLQGSLQRAISGADRYSKN